MTTGTRDGQTIAQGSSANETRRDFQFASRLDVQKSTAIGFTTNATIYDTGRTVVGVSVGDVVEVRGSPLNSRHWRVETYAAGSAAVQATGNITFALNPSNNATITLNGTVVTFKTSAGASPEVQIGASLAATLTALLAILNASADAQLVKFTYTVDATKLYLTAVTAGTGGNALTIAASVATPSDATLAGGAAAVNRSYTVSPAMVQTEATGAAIQLVRV